MNMKKKAEQVRDEVAAKYAGQGYPNGPEVKPGDWWSDYAGPDSYCVQWEEGPYEWALGYRTEVPGVWTEPYNSFVAMVIED